VARQPVQKGWDLFANPVPGNVFACLQELGVETIRQNDDEILGRCPAHFERTGKQDRHPSWSVNAETGMHNCFSCGFSGTFVELAAFMLPKDEDAVAWVRQRGGVERAKRILDKHRSASITEIDTSEVINEASLALFTDPPEWAMEERGLTLEACRHFGVLWDPKKDSWIIPIREPYSDRLLGYQIKNKRYFRNVPKDMEKSGSLFGFNEHEGDVVILVESPLDVVRLYSIGIKGGVAAYGVRVSAKQMRMAIDLADVLIVALDNDKDGRYASADIKTRYSGQVRMRFLSYTHCDDVKDVGAMSEEEAHIAIDSAVPSVLVKF
jgi:hypothetical protein